MKTPYSLALMIALAMLLIASPAVAQTIAPEEPMRVTLYSPEKYKLTNAPPLSDGSLRPDFSRAYFSFTSGRLSTARDWDLSYGTVGGWFVVGLGIGDDRSAIKDLGKADWNDKFQVPVVAPLPELEPGEARYITTGPAKKGEGFGSIEIRRIPSADPIDDWPQSSTPNRETNTNGSNEAKRPEPAPVLAKILPGHMYVIHVVKAQSDFYVLVRVDSLKTGDNCTISWKRIPAPGIVKN